MGFPERIRLWRRRAFRMEGSEKTRVLSEGKGVQEGGGAL